MKKILTIRQKRVIVVGDKILLCVCSGYFSVAFVIKRLGGTLAFGY